MSDPNDQRNDVVIERSLAAPIATVWQMWTVAEHFASWYGPPGAVISVSTFEVAVGGSRLLNMTMATPEGEMAMWFTGTFTEVNPVTRLVYTDVMCDESGTPTSPETMGMPAGTDMSTTVVVELAEHGESTQMTMTHIGVPADSPGAQGWATAIDKLEAALAA